jgi:aldehyde dehydrogenase (NAD+)
MATPENKLAFDDGWQYSPAPESTDHIKIKKRYGLFIGGEFVAPEKGKYFDTINPATEGKLSRVALASDADVDKAVKAARKAYGPWARLKAAERGKYIYRIARIMQERAREFAAIESLDHVTSTFHSLPRTSSTTRAGPTNSSMRFQGVKCGRWVSRAR